MSTTLSKRHLRRAFPDDNVEVHRIEPTQWLEGNQVFQIRTGLYTCETILDYGATWSRIGVSKIGQRFFVVFMQKLKENRTHASPIGQFYVS